jgi:lipopolysaccharide/colanic/teichoic acid biosynthesis glycosyltransferase
MILSELWGIIIVAKIDAEHVVLSIDTSFALVISIIIIIIIILLILLVLLFSLFTSPSPPCFATLRKTAALMS